MTVHDRSALGPRVGEASFDAYYYEHCCGRPYERNAEWLAFFGGIADRLVADLRPRTVLDAGCALGLLVETLRDRGVEAFGIDISGYAIAHVDDRVRPYCRQASLTDGINDRFDLVVCIEVVEHMPPREAEAAIVQICHHTDDIVFSSSPLDYKEPTHVNVHGPAYWAQQFARQGFYRDVDYDASFITPWAVRFRKGHEPVHRIVADYERRYAELSLERNEVRSFSAEVQEKLAHALRQLDDERATLVNTHAALEEARTAFRDVDVALHEERRRRETAQADLASTNGAMLATQRELTEARDRIDHMERSLFWKARRPWEWISRLFR
jgi:SAM-dependent methyltransferase